MSKTPDEVKLGLQCCGAGNSCRGHCPYDGRRASIYGCTSQLARDSLALLHNVAAERDEFKEALMLMVYQYCATGLASEGGILDHRFMSAGETAFRVLGLKQFDSVAELEEKLFGTAANPEEIKYAENV